MAMANTNAYSPRFVPSATGIWLNISTTPASGEYSAGGNWPMMAAFSRLRKSGPGVVAGALCRRAETLAQRHWCGHKKSVEASLLPHTW